MRSHAWIMIALLGCNGTPADDADGSIPRDARMHDARVHDARAVDSGSIGRPDGAIHIDPRGTWVDITPPGSPGCSGVVVDRLTGDVLVAPRDGGVLVSTDQGDTFARVDGGAVGGVVVVPQGFDVDQNQPHRAAVWSLDGLAGYTSDGVTWRSMAPIARNWDFGATDWSVAHPQTMVGVLHESGGQVYLSTDGAAHWTLLPITILASGASFPPPRYAMVGVVDATTLLYGNGDGIYRSTDTGASFTRVSDENVQTRVAVVFEDRTYLGGEEGLIVSDDGGASWFPQGSSLEMWVGPFFGADARSIVVANSAGIYRSDDAGTNWTLIAELPEDMIYDPRIWGSIAWDPVHDILYAAALQSPLMKLVL